jgi:hypothetical protein
MSVSGNKHILFVSMLVLSFVAFGEGPKTQVAKADTLINDDVLVDDHDEDILSVSKKAPEVSTNAPKDTAKAPEVTAKALKDTAKTPVVTTKTPKDTIKNAAVTTRAQTDTTKKDSAKAASQAKIKESDEVLILDGDAEDLLGTVKGVKPADSASKPHQQVESPNIAGEHNSDSIGAKTTPNVVTPVVRTPAKVIAQKPTTIEATNSINFARNLKEYRSPKIAMLLSFLLPGAGEIYAKNGVRATAFGIVEAGIIAAGAAYSVKGKNQIDEAHGFADQHYSADRFKTYYQNLAKNFPDIVDTIFKSYYYDVEPTSFSKKTKDYNDLIGDQVGPFVQGWDDVTPKFGTNFELSDTTYHRLSNDTSSTYDSSYLVFEGNDSSKIAYGFSKNQDIYNSKISKGNKSYKISKSIFTLLLINHVVSAIDAGICAKAYNDKLLGKQSFWQRINIRDVAVNSGSGTASGYALEVRF